MLDDLIICRAVRGENCLAVIGIDHADATFRAELLGELACDQAVEPVLVSTENDEELFARLFRERRGVPASILRHLGQPMEVEKVDSPSRISDVDNSSKDPNRFQFFMREATVQAVERSTLFLRVGPVFLKRGKARLWEILFVALSQEESQSDDDQARANEGKPVLHEMLSC